MKARPGLRRGLAVSIMTCSNVYAKVETRLPSSHFSVIGTDIQAMTASADGAVAGKPYVERVVSHGSRKPA